MAVITAGELVEFVKKAATDLWGYVLGGNGEMYSKALAEKWAATRNKPSSWIGTKYAYFVTACARWFGHHVADCSGLIVAAHRSKSAAYQDQKADTFFSRCTKTGKISTIPEIPGLCVRKTGHIGVYLGGGYAIEARGRTYGVVRTKVSARPWTHWGELKDVDYNINESEDETMLTIRDNGPEVKYAQEILIRIGAGGEMNPAKTGTGGDKSSKALQAWKRSVGLPVNDDLDPATWVELAEADKAHALAQQQERAEAVAAQLLEAKAKIDAAVPHVNAAKAALQG
jgi:hypothetical protein